MPFDLYRAINISTDDCLNDIRKQEITDFNNDDVLDLIWDHADSATPVEYHHLLDIYLNYHNQLEPAEPARAELDPFINWNALMASVHLYIYRQISANIKAELE